MHEFDEPSRKYAWVLHAVAAGLVGLLGGYILAVQGGRPPAPVEATVAAPAATPLLDASELRAYRDILARDPKNLAAAVKAGNLLYDAQRYAEAIPFYQQAFALNPRDINVSTDLGTALWYAGQPDEALAQYDKSLGIDASHAQTLFNIGIVRADGKRNYAGAIAVWETLLKLNLGYPEVAKVKNLIADAHTKTST